MDPARIHFVRIAGAVRGPLAVEHLREMATIDVVTAATETAPGPDGPWTALGQLPLWEDVRPRPPQLKFKEATFEQINQGDTPVMDPTEAIEQANRPPASLRGREVVYRPQGRHGTFDHEGPNEVQQLVQDVNRRVAANAPPEILPPPPPRFPNWPWFLGIALLGTAGLLSIPLFYDRQYDTFSVSILGGWVVLYNGFLVFVMVNDRKLANMIRKRKIEWRDSA